MDYYNYYSSDDEDSYDSRAAPNFQMRGNAQAATTLRISEAMTVRQLKEECKLRGIRKYSGLTKHTMLDLLGVGTVWMSVSVPNMKQERKARQKQPKSSTTRKKNVAPPPKKKEPSPIKNTPIKKKPSVNWITMPKVSNSMTVAQMTHELMTRGYTGSVSKKNKTDLLVLLGEGSIWTTAPRQSRVPAYGSKILRP
eukprot:scaffold8204_cov177-Amphora_coffeaeformis.AAC.3